jgi:hypothetical protein
MTFSNTEAHLASKNARNAIQRVTDLEKRVTDLEESLQKVIDATNSIFKDIHTKMDAMSELARATVEVVGVEAVEQTLLQNRRADDDRNTQNLAKQVADGLANGDLKAAEVIGENSLLVFTEKGKDGQPLQLGARKQFLMSQVLPEFRDGLMGKGVGATITSASGNTFEVIEFYDAIPKATPATSAVPEAK